MDANYTSLKLINRLYDICVCVCVFFNEAKFLKQACSVAHRISSRTMELGLDPTARRL